MHLTSTGNFRRNDQILLQRITHAQDTCSRIDRRSDDREIKAVFGPYIALEHITGMQRQIEPGMGQPLGFTAQVDFLDNLAKGYGRVNRL